MTESNRQRFTIACAVATAIVIPLSILVPLLELLMAVGLGALYYLWFARSYSWLIISTTVAAAILWWVGDPGHLAFFALGVLVPGMIIAMTRRHGWGLTAALAAACAVPIVVLAIFHEGFAQYVAAFGEALRTTIASPQFSLFYPPDRYQQAVEYVNTWADNAPYYFPGAMLSLLVFIYTIGAIVGEALITRANIYSYRISPFIRWKLDEWMVLVVGVAVIMVLTKEQLFEIVGWNALLFLFMVFSVFGISFLEYHMRIRKFSLPVKIVVYLVLFLAQIVAAVALPLIALFDARFDFRKIRAKQLG